MFTSLPAELKNFFVGADSISMDSHPMNFIGQGTFGEVRKGVWRHHSSGNVDVAIKFLPFFDSNMLKSNSKLTIIEKSLESFLEDCVILSQLSHENILPFSAIVTNSSYQPLYLIMQLVQSGSLRDLMYGPHYSSFRNRPSYIESSSSSKKSKQSLPKSTIFSLLDIEICTHILIDICAGLKYLHSRSPIICHHNLKPTNILIEVHGNTIVRAILSDIGKSYSFYRQETNSSSTATAHSSIYQETITLTYAAANHHSNSTSSITSENDIDHEDTVAMAAGDIYSFGMIVFELLSGQKPQQPHPPKLLETPAECTSRVQAYTTYAKTCISPSLHILCDHLVIPSILHERAERPSASALFHTCKLFRGNVMKCNVSSVTVTATVGSRMKCFNG